MDPVFQRFGDVTIQRLEKPREPKVGPQNNSSTLDKNREEIEPEPPTSSEEDSGEESEMIPHSLKRSLPSSEITVKKFKFDKSGDITLEKKISNNAKISQEISDDMNVNNFSDTEISDYESETDIESEGEMNELGHSEIPGISGLPGIPGDISVKETPKQVFKEDEEEEEEEEDDEIEHNEASFLEKLVEEPFLDSTSNSSKPPVESAPPTDSDDYDYDIKEKLKEMGEISFETVKKGEKPKKTEISTENEVSVTPARKSGMLDEEITAERLKASGVNLRRNIREVMDETKLDEATLAAQRLEMERLRRVQEQQRLIRELQRQAAQERMQHKVLSLLQGNSMPKPGTSGTRIGNTVLVKLPNGQTKPMTRLPKRPFELLRVQKGGPMGAPQSTRSLLASKKPGANLTPSVSIAPINKKPPSTVPKAHSDSDSEAEERRLAIPQKRKPKDASSTPTPIEVSSDDDCIVVSESEGEPGADEPEEDPSNSGMHTNDEFNQPDEQGRVLVNVGHPDNEPDIFVAPQIARIIKPHQIGGVRFLYDNVVESTTRFESSAGFGCILAHSMGLGKTLQVVCFSDIFLRHTPAKTILCIMPINTLQNWLAEYNMWLPTEDAAANSPLNVHGEVRPRNFNLHVLNDSHKTLMARAKVIHEWRSKGGVLLIGYEMFRLLSLKKHPKSRRKPNPKQQVQEDDKNKLLFDEVHEALVHPGPDLVICDEGHRIKNSHASISQALKQMRTKRRVVLTGYPLQNNLMEYWCMVDFVRPNYLGTKTEFCNMFERPIMNGQCIDSTDADIKLMRYRAHVLHSLLVGFVQRRSHTVLQMALPQKEEYVLLVRMTRFQRKLYETFMNEVVRSQTVPNPLKAFAICCKIWNHPDVLYNFLKKRAGGDAVDIDLEEVANTTVPNETTTRARKTPARPRRNAAKGKNAKPAASVTPYNSTGDQTPTENNTPPQPSTSSAGHFTSITQSLQPITSECNDLPSSFCQNSDGSFHNESFAQNPTFFDFEQTNSQFPPGYTEKNQMSTNNFGENYLDNCQSQQNTTTDFSSAMSPSGLNFNFTSQTGSSQQNNNFNSGVTPVESISTPPPPSSSSNLLELTPSKGQNTSSFTNTLTDHSAQNADNQMNDCQFSQNQNSSNFNQNTPLPTFENFNQPNFQNYHQNYWGQQTESYNQQNDYFDTCGQPYNPNFSSNTTGNTWIKKEENASNNSWIKKEENASSSSWMKKEEKPFMMSPVKNEMSNDSKPKINIISDIKLPPVFTPPEKKITILSDIKIEPKKEEVVEDKSEIKLEPPKFEPPKPEPPKLEPPKPKEEPSIEEKEKTEEKTPEKAPIESPLAKLSLKDLKEDGTIPYDWAIELLKDYVPGHIENSGKMEILFCIIRESIALGDRLLVFSQSLITLDLIEQFLQMNTIPGDTVKWARNVSYYRLDGSTSALEREKLINEFNSNPKIHLFLVSTRAGSLGINLIGANRVVVLDASWNPCHDTQAVCRVYRYGQRKPCFVYRLVVDNCLEKKIYDRQINKQGMSDRVVDECNPDAHLTMKDVSTLCWDDNKDDGEEKDWSFVKDNYIDVVLQKVLDYHGRRLNKEPFQHESLLVDRKEKQLSQLEKRLAKKGYEREKQASRQPAYNMAAGARGHRPVASVRPMQQGERPSRWIPAEHWQRQGMTAQEMTLPLDVVIPTNQPEKGNIVLKAGQKVLVLKSPKGVYMQLESGKIVAIKTAIKVKGKAEDNHDPMKMIKPPTLPPSMKMNPPIPAMPQKRMVKPFTPGMAKMNVRSVRQAVPNLVSHIKNVSKKVQMTKSRPYQIGSEIAKAVSQKENESHMMPSSNTSSDDEHGCSSSASEERKVKTPIPPMVPSSPEEERFVENKEINKRISMLKKQISIQRVPASSQKQQMQKHAATSSALEQLEHTTSSVMNESNLPFQDTLDSITNNYKDDTMEDEESLPSSTEQKQAQSQAGSDVSDQSDDVTYVSEHSVQPSAQQQPYQQQPNDQSKQENQTGQEYNYNNYYGYQPYHAPHPPPPQGYGYPPPQPPPYDMMGGYPPQHQQPPQYNYGYQGYPPPPPQPHYPPPPPQPGYDYNAPPPPQPMYGGYHAPYPPQQYPPPPPPQGMYPPPPAPANAPPAPFPDYQYPPMSTAPPQSQSYYPNT